MREYTLPALILLCLATAFAQTEAPAWKPIKDPKGACQIQVPPDWAPLGEAAGAAVFRDTSTALAAVTSQPGQTFKPLSETLLKLLEIPKSRLFENTSKRVFYQDKVSRGAEDPNGYSISVPGKDGSCGCHIIFVPGVPEETVRKIALSLAPVPAE